ncbi:MAG: cysteinyl-tRNA synthetase [Desulfomicrobiaceae bacterium]|jgi:cysteinyl-tRNA synthetase|nr:cysteinyl-tRNA synthetase [Desulfomicrobiaceae bacterium]
MQLYNTLTRKKEPFQPLRDGHVSMYVCGITAYDYCHIGHARSAVVFDVLVRYLRSIGYKVTFVRNFTDVDDKIIARAAREGVDEPAVAATYIAAFHEDMERLGVVQADVEPKATEHIPDMIALCQKLIQTGRAYATADGSVYFRVRSFPPYGQLSGHNLDDLRSGARVEPGEGKEDPLDFALWKGAKPGEPSWESPWGAGRPGWHIECSAMSERYLPLPLDIHGGGQDLVFPHHENEAAQTEAATGKPLARFWVHNGFVQIDAEKMSKSLGNFITIRDILSQHHPETLRLFLLTKHYRSPLDYTLAAMEEAETALRRAYLAKAAMEDALGATKSWTEAPLPAELVVEATAIETKWDEAMDDDLNTAAALGHTFAFLRLVSRVLEDKALRRTTGARDFLRHAMERLEGWGNVLGILLRPAAQFLSEVRTVRIQRRGIDTEAVDRLVAERQEARKAKDFAKADSLREKLAAMGVTVQDTPSGPTWDVD